ncbi:MAG: ABC transporter substrate-binding protein, partial [bacterium]|nr:ABC transporter substrate-binding protein [bacterium]
RKVKLIFLNDECKSEKGIANAQKLAHQHKVLLVIGSSCSSVTLPMVDVLTKAEVPQITPHSTNSDITKRGSAWIFRVPISSRFYKAVAAENVAKNVGTRVAYLISADAASLSFGQEMQAHLKEHYGVDPAMSVTIQQQEMDVRPHLLKAKSLDIDALVITMGTVGGAAKSLVQSYEVGIPASVARVMSSGASKQEIPTLAGDAVKGVFYAAAFSAMDTRPIAQLFRRMVNEKYDAEPDHDFSQAWDLVQIVRIALERADIKNTPETLAADRTAVRDALTSVKNYQGLASGPISFCADPTPECRDGNRTPVLIEYIKGGKDFETRVLTTITFPADFGLNE